MAVIFAAASLERIVRQMRISLCRPHLGMAEQPPDDLKRQAAARADARESMAEVINPRVVRGRGQLYSRLFGEPMASLTVGVPLRPRSRFHEGRDPWVLGIAPKSNRGLFGYGIPGCPKLLQRFAVRLPRENEVALRAPRV